MKEIEARLGCFYCKFYSGFYRTVYDPEKKDGIMMIHCERDSCPFRES